MDQADRQDLVELQDHQGHLDHQVLEDPRDLQVQQEHQDLLELVDQADRQDLVDLQDQQEPLDHQVQQEPLERTGPLELLE